MNKYETCIYLDLIFSHLLILCACVNACTMIHSWDSEDKLHVGSLLRPGGWFQVVNLGRSSWVGWRFCQSSFWAFKRPNVPGNCPEDEGTPRTLGRWMWRPGNPPSCSSSPLSSHLTPPLLRERPYLIDLAILSQFPNCCLQQFWELDAKWLLLRMSKRIIACFLCSELTIFNTLLSYNFSRNKKACCYNKCP